MNRIGYMLNRLTRRLVIALPVVALATFVGILFWFLHSPAGLSAIDQLRSTTVVGLHLLALSLIAGTASMAVVEVRKRLSRTRGRFHLIELESHLGESPFFLLGFPRYGSREEMIRRLDIPLEQVVALLASAAEQAVLKPIENRWLLYSIGGAQAAEAAANISELSENSEPDETKLGEQHALLRQAVEQGLDFLQIDLGSRWRFRQRVEAILVAGGVGLGALLLTDTGPSVKAAVLATTLFWGGFFAWLARDVVAVIEKWRD